MIPLGPGDIPVNQSEIESRVASTLAKLIGTGSAPAVHAHAPSPDTIHALNVDLTGVEVAATRAVRPSGLVPLGNVAVASLKLIGTPAYIHGAPAEVSAESWNIPMQWMRDDRGDLWLTINDAANDTSAAFGGNLRASIKTSDLEKAATVFLADLAQQNGARLKDLQLRVDVQDNSRIHISANIAASKFMMTARLQALAEATLDSNLDLKLENVSLSGDGGAGSMVANMLDSKVGEWRGKTFSLGQFVFAGASVKNITLRGGNELSISGEFGT